MRESKKAYNWLSKEARKRGQTLVFKEYWVTNKDSTLNYNFVYKLPSNSLKVLTRKHNFKMLTRKKTKTQEKIIERVSWRKNMLDSISKQVADSAIASLVLNRKAYHSSDNTLIAIHILKARKSKILGFYDQGQIFIGNSKSSIIAHETLHYLGAPDLYIHYYWFGKRRRIVKKDLDQEVMNFAQGKTFDCSTHYISNYTAYTVGWEKKLDQTYKPILKENLMAKIIFFIALFF